MDMNTAYDEMLTLLEKEIYKADVDFTVENDGIDGILTDDYSDIDRGEHMDLFDHLEQDIELYG